LHQPKPEQLCQGIIDLEIQLALPYSGKVLAEMIFQDLAGIPELLFLPGRQPLF
jgi:hypothetical protein